MINAIVMNRGRNTKSNIGVRIHIMIMGVV
jgi:hypothetical protein